ncbi:MULTISPECIES: hypothetical protein [Streptomyces]|uniref:Uncharacterized protein n=1 Tax=Streptomyces lonegramiae TaxID=3075524 RepID=A0ABU2XMP3_9ACTN|nr:hypothetical protein [Streptomyces sp. DSM 41529]MDT0547191.1 hypothetical protein [Streptomyces sp. DSM 41529]
MSPFGKGMAKGAETLAKFKGRIDKILSDLENSPASQKKFDEQIITRAAYGAQLKKVEWSADSLAKSYDTVHENLKAWSKIFGDQIEAMGLAALIAEKGYDAIDADQRRRMQEIQAEAAKYYRDPETGQQATGSEQGGSHTKKNGY